MKTQLFIAAGGEGRRLGNVTLEIPKSLVVVHGKPIIDHIVTCGRVAGIDQMVIGLDDGKKDIRDYAIKSGVELEYNCSEPLTKAFFTSIMRRKPDIILGTNGDTLYHHGSLLKVIDMLTSDDSAAAAVLLTSIIRPIETSNWVYWRHNFNDGVMISMDEVPGHQITTEYVVSAYRFEAIMELSDNFSNFFENYHGLPFKCYSYGWDYILRLILWHGLKVIGYVSDDLSININTPQDLEEAELFFVDSDKFKAMHTAIR